MMRRNVSCYREINQDRMEEFCSKGYKERHFFPHRLYYLPKSCPDGYPITFKLFGHIDPKQIFEIVLYAISPAIDEFPRELFFDSDLIWHQQQFGRVGQIATANLMIDHRRLYSMILISDIVQRISRARTYKTRIKKNFDGWAYMLLNGVVNFALENSMKELCFMTSELALETTDPTRVVQRDLFERVYDRAVGNIFPVQKNGRWWTLDLMEHRNCVIVPEKKEEIIEKQKTVCIAHDIEKGLGHMEVDPDFADSLNKSAPLYLQDMLSIEKEFSLRATYNVVGCMLSEVRKSIEANGHCLAFHSYNHQIDKPWLYSRTRTHKVVRHLLTRLKKNTAYRYGGQLIKCRGIDYRIRGYRPPRSKITLELTDENMCYHNFEWLASSKWSLEMGWHPEMKNGIVRIPIILDDFDMYIKGMSYDTWEQEAFRLVKQYEFAVICLHDCYANFWLPHYRTFLDKITKIGKTKTLNEVADEVILTSSC